MGPFGWLLQWPIRALVSLVVVALPIGIQMTNFSTAIWSVVVIGLLGTVLIAPLKVVLGPLWAITSLGGLISPVSLLFNWLITIILFGVAAWLIDGFRLRNGLFSAIFGAVAYSLISVIVLRMLGLVDLDLTHAALIATNA